MLLLTGELNSSAASGMDNCFGGLFSPVPAVITMAGTFLWICKKRFFVELCNVFSIIATNCMEGGDEGAGR